MGKVSLVGAGMRSHPGVAAKVFGRRAGMIGAIIALKSTAGRCCDFVWSSQARGSAGSAWSCAPWLKAQVAEAVAHHLQRDRRQDAERNDLRREAEMQYQRQQSGTDGKNGIDIQRTVLQNSSARISIGSSAIPHFGQVPGPICTISGSIGQV